MSILIVETFRGLMQNVEFQIYSENTKTVLVNIFTYLSMPDFCHRGPPYTCQTEPWPEYLDPTYNVRSYWI